MADSLQPKSEQRAGDGEACRFWSSMASDGISVSAVVALSHRLESRKIGGQQ